MPKTPKLPEPPAILPPLVYTEPVNASAVGQQRIMKDLGRQLRALENLKVGSVTIRTTEMVEEILHRLRSGEALYSICADDTMPGTSTVKDWMRADPELKAAIQEAREEGMDTIYDIQLDIALGGIFSTEDRERDRIVIQALNNVASKRNRAAFGEKVEVSHRAALTIVSDPREIELFTKRSALPAPADGEFTEVPPEPGKDDD